MKFQGCNPARRMTVGRIAPANARDHSRRFMHRTLTISAQMPKQAHTHSSAGMPMMTKMKSGAMGVDSSAIKSSGIPIATQTGQSLLADNPFVGLMTYLNAKRICLFTLYRKVKGASTGRR